MEFLAAREVVKQYSNHLALNRVSISVPEKSIFGLLGPNGAGKTTLIRIINQITAPDSGEILFNQRKLRKEDVHQIGYLPEERGLYKKMKVGEQALYLVRLKGLSRHDGLKRLKYWFEKFEIQPWWDKKVEELSKGMQQKVQFIVTVLHEPRLLIFDEPFTGFDPINTNLIKKEILELRDKGSTILFSTHVMSSVEELCDHIALINRSNCILMGSMDEIRREFNADTYKLSFKGDGDQLIRVMGDKLEIMAEPGTGELRSFILKKKGRITVREMIEQINHEVEIHSFIEMIPSMNDIFIRAVEQTNVQTSKSVNHE